MVFILIWKYGSVEGGTTRGTTALVYWFIDSYIAAYIQVQYRVIGVHPIGLTVARGLPYAGVHRSLIVA
jgi:hypothetical protein